MNILKPKGRAVPSSGTSLNRQWQANIGEHVIAMAWSPDGTLLAAAAVGGPIFLFDEAGSLRHTLAGHAVGTAALSWHPSGQRLASIGQDGHVRVWDAASGEQTQALRLTTSWGERVGYSPDGRMLAGAAGKSLRLWDESGALLNDWTDHASTIADIGWKPDSSVIAAVAYGGTTLWVPGQAEPLRRYEWKGSSLVLAWSPDMVFFATGDQDSTVHFWYVENGHDLQMWGYETKMRELSWDPTSRYLATGGGRDVVVWNCYSTKNGPEGSKPIMLGLHESYVSGLAYQHRQASTNAPALLASIGNDGLLVLWRPTKGQRPLAQFELNTPLCQLGWSPDDQRLAVAGEDGGVHVFRVS